MTLLTRWPDRSNQHENRDGAPGREMLREPIGNALVVHQVDRLSAEARDLALAIPADPEHDVVVVDLPGDVVTESPIAAWQSLARLLPRGKRGVRLVLSDRPRETTALAGQWLADRLKRPVLVPDGQLLPSPGGGLYVDAVGGGWIRFEAGKRPSWDARRFPRPVWESAALAETTPTSSRGVAEPITGGVWIRPVGPENVVSEHRDRLRGVPCQHGRLTIVLGCPGVPALSLDDVTRYLQRVPEAQARRRIRFVGYGPVATRSGLPFGQDLANELGEQIACYTGLPVNVSADPDVLTVGRDGTASWPSFVTELGYEPLADTPTGAAPPRLLSYRPPVADLVEEEPAVYWYATDAVVEVVPAGLWVRPRDDIGHAAMIRGMDLDPDQLLLMYEASTAELGSRMYTLADDILHRLSPAAAGRCQLVPTQEVLGHEVAVHDTILGQRAVAHDAGGVLEPEVVPASERLPAERPDEASPVRALEENLPASLVTPSSVTEQPVTSSVTRQPVSPELVSVEPPLPAAPAPSDRAAPGAAAPTAAPTVPPAAPTAARTGNAAKSQKKPEKPGTSAETTNAGARQRAGQPKAAERPKTAERPKAAQQPKAAEQSNTAKQPNTAEQAKPAKEPSAAAAPAQTAAPSARPQGTPDPAAAALVPERGLAEERAWLQRTLSKQFTSMANSVARVLSEHPGFKGLLVKSADDVLTDAVAVRMYLSSDGDELDAPLRQAVAGPHVPFARCVVSGLSRLPSHRGAVTFRAWATGEQLAVFRKRKFVTEWGFVNALSAPCAAAQGNLDVLLWSMTARRTRLLEPELEPVADRVLFVPGTSFKILDLVEPTDDQRGRLILREVAAGEIDPNGKVADNRASLDDMAVTSLRKYAEEWHEKDLPVRVGPSAQHRFAALPGLR